MDKTYIVLFVLILILPMLFNKKLDNPITLINMLLGLMLLIMFLSCDENNDNDRFSFGSSARSRGGSRSYSGGK